MNINLESYCLSQAAQMLLAELENKGATQVELRSSARALHGHTALGREGISNKVYSIAYKVFEGLKALFSLVTLGYVKSDHQVMSTLLGRVSIDIEAHVAYGLNQPADKLEEARSKDPALDKAASHFLSKEVVSNDNASLEDQAIVSQSTSQTTPVSEKAKSSGGFFAWLLGRNKVPA